MRIFRWSWLLGAGLLLLITCQSRRKPTDEVMLSGQQLAERYCQGCHPLPSPDLLDKATWRASVLPQMGYRLGIYEDTVRGKLIGLNEEGQLLASQNIFPAQPLLAAESWEKIKHYFLTNAPDRLPSPDTLPIQLGLPHFQTVVPPWSTPRPSTSLVYIEPSRQRLFANDIQGQRSLTTVWNGTDRTTWTLPLPSPLSDLQTRGDTLLLTLMGDLHPHDLPKGFAAMLFPRPDGAEGWDSRPLAPSLQRPVHTSYADLNADGRTDLVVCNFGYRTGHLSWYEQQADSSFTAHTLRPLPGAIKTVVTDLDGDQRPDILALMAQGDEGFYLYHNEGNGRFREERLLRFPPSWGSTGFEWVDFDQDGYHDLLVTNGDNGDYSPILKPYHGIRLYLNDGTNHFNEAWFFAQNGANRAVARDFDQDGDLDIASVSFFADYSDRPKEAFVYLQNQGDLTFSGFTMPEHLDGRWITLDAGDWDGDGDDDLVLGNFAGYMQLQDTLGLRERWLEGPPLLLLENTFSRPQ
ncbi:Repeat domain-containing protein [Catalinimonas alkaloidigena]|uniref:Repeat domain-containing protein n=1 Tax=Catalinimonas alkaloidigena TaxID=1075417 RepID=A0A1G9PIT4_9BACT|nr:VCBS repeat-containing protein [Catalinimonas alkaloidigena]SDL98718.1 Repeat domain-containing protein [Catalinimonas alkaloidigena]